MSDAWQEIQAIKSKRNSLREKLQKRKIERQVILSETADKSVLSEYYTDFRFNIHKLNQILKFRRIFNTKYK